MTEASDLDTVIDLLRVAARWDPRVLTDEECCEHVALVEDVGRLVDALRLASAADLARRSRPVLGQE